METSLAPTARRSWTVSALCRSVSDVLDSHMNPVVVRGEIGGFVQASSGHCYFNLKDAQAQVRCAMFRRAVSASPTLPVNGDQVEVVARLGLHAARGDLQLIVEQVRPAGVGASMEQFLRLKAVLEAQGLFDAARKRPLTRAPKRIGLVTSPDAAALSDVLTTLQRRVPHVGIVLSPCAVQGVGAEQSIVQALEALFACCGEANASPDVACEVILVVRGGGAWEDLHAFNEESVVRCIARSPVPVVSGIGHETDFTLADFVSDVRAATPTAAAELCAISTAELLRELEAASSGLQEALAGHLNDHAQQLDWLAAVLSRPDEAHRKNHVALDALGQRLGRCLSPLLMQRSAALDYFAQSIQATGKRYLERATGRMQLLEQRVASANPRNVLSRGYAWLENASGLVKAVENIAVGDSVRATLADGVVELKAVNVTKQTFLE